MRVVGDEGSGRYGEDIPEDWKCSQTCILQLEISSSEHIPSDPLDLSLAHVHRSPLFIFLIQFPERLCADGLVFNEYDINVEKCDLPNNIDCSKKSQLREFYFLAIQWSDSILWFPLETPIPSQNCPRKNGYFAHASANICDKFFYCVDGECIGRFFGWRLLLILGFRFRYVQCNHMPCGTRLQPKDRNLHMARPSS